MKKKKIIMFSIIILEIMLLMLIFPKTVSAAIEKEIQKVEIEIPEPVVGEKPADATKVSVTADGEKFEIDTIRWMQYNTATNQYEEITDLKLMKLDGLNIIMKQSNMNKS